MILICYASYETSSGVRPLYIKFDEKSGYIKNNDGINYPTLIPIDEYTDAVKKYKQIWEKLNQRKIMLINTSKSDLVRVIVYH